MVTETLLNRVPIFEIWKLTAPPFLKEGTYFIDQLSEEDFIPKTKPKKDASPGLTTAQRKTLQWERTLLNKNWPYFDKENFLDETKDYESPLHFIDFETATVAIPFNKGRRPYEQVAFQFSHHLLNSETGTVEHRGEWINTEPGNFPNFDFVRALKKELEPDNGTIFRYSHHENTVLCQIRNQLLQTSDLEVPDRNNLIKWIETITEPTEKILDRWQAARPMVDLLDLVQRFFWHPRMRGSNSIKAVLPAILESSKYLQEKYSKPIYGAAGGIKSRNYVNHIWIQHVNGSVQDPYKLLPPVFDKWDRGIQ